MPKEIIYVFVAFIAIAAIYFMYSSLRVNRKEGETSSVKDDSKKVAKMVLDMFPLRLPLLPVWLCWLSLNPSL